MSWTWAVQQINRSLEQLGNWYYEFMHRAEQAFQALHERVSYLEDRQAWQGPSDEQVERILRKILAERFADAGVQRVENPNVMKASDYFVERPKDASVPKTIPMDVTSLQVDPSAVPSKAYQQTLEMLQDGLDEFPHVDLHKSADKHPSGFKVPRLPNTQHQTKQWS
ncbi:hypothetical protein BDV95DRAFT_501768 [Massariosphaeria phaeospora]|uniref:Uncharacterized protein n=1 Tax=Massariosphaeria phaeospora TaxID=100035 RepID=A0A7C8M427_9PLEO|nr:hypothetical protein BDV95DRAFT_501768 [Massariosphaeria phaeospora]